MPRVKNRAQASSSFSPDEMVAGTDVLSPLEDYKAHEEFLRRIAQNLGIQVEEISPPTLSCGHLSGNRPCESGVAP